MSRLPVSGLKSKYLCMEGPVKNNIIIVFVNRTRQGDGDQLQLCTIWTIAQYCKAVRVHLWSMADTRTGFTTLGRIGNEYISKTKFTSN